MITRLRKIAFAEPLLASDAVRAFECGREEWEVEVSDWLKRPSGAGGAVDDLRQPGTRVWLYIDHDGALVGVGSVGHRELKWPNPNKSKPRLTTSIPMLGVASAFRNKGYGKEILSDLIDVAREDAAVRRLVVLSVHERNPALKFYTDRNFAVFGKPRQLVANGPQYWRLVLDLDPDQPASEPPKPKS